MPGAGDLWAHEGALFLANSEELTVSRVRVEGGELVEEARIGFSGHGLSDVGFWNTAFVAPDKAYTLNGAAEYVVWNPEAMEITGSIDFPALDVPSGFAAFPAYQDRARAVRDGRIYQPFYVTDESFFLFQPITYVVVVDIASDSVVEVLEAPCPGLDFTAVGEDGTLYFSAWVYSPGGAAFLEQPATCVAQLPPGGTSITRAFDVADVTAGRQGGALHHLGGGRGLFSVLHDERAPDGGSDPRTATFAANWRFWSFDFSSHEASPIDGFDWNAGAHYPVEIDGEPLILVAEADYSATTIYRTPPDGPPSALFETTGWALRLFRVR